MENGQHGQSGRSEKYYWTYLKLRHEAMSNGVCSFTTYKHVDSIEHNQWRIIFKVKILIMMDKVYVHFLLINKDLNK